MKRRNSIVVKIMVLFFALNSLSLFLYFNSYFHSSTSHRPSSSLLPHRKTLPPRFLLKPWPTLPSFLPWPHSQHNPSLSRTCEAYFGHGFTRRLDLIAANSSSGWFRCFHSETLRSSICEGGMIRMVAERIQMSRGGEDLREVLGRSEEDELPVFLNGAFQVLGGDESERERQLVSREVLDEYLPRGDIMRHTMRDLVASMWLVPNKDFACDQWIEEPTLLVTRFEYANMFHTITDWYSAYVSSRVTGLPNRPRLIFVDGHCMTPLEETWNALFSSIGYAKNHSGSVCFRHAVLSPLGYETALFKGLTEDINCDGESARNLWQNPDDHKTARLSEFGEMIKAAFELPLNQHHTRKSNSGHNVLFVRREDYLAHPRHGGKVESRLSNEAEVFNSLKNWASSYEGCKINLVNGLFAHMAMKEQVQAIQDASVIIGAHGAGLTHIVSALPKTVILEIISSQFRRPHFQLISRWKGLEYHAINLSGSYANPQDVINELTRIMKSLGC